MKTKKKNVGDGWQYFYNERILVMNRTGWSGLADRLVAWWTGKPQRTVKVTYEVSVYGKGGNIKILIWGEQAGEGPDL